MIFIDDAKRWISIDLMCRKSEVFKNYWNYEAWLSMQFGANIKVFQSDKGGEYTLNKFRQHTKSKGTVHRFTVHKVHGQSSIPEHTHYTLLNSVQALLSASGLPALLWGEALTLGADPYLPSRHIESFLRVFKQFAYNIPRG